MVLLLWIFYVFFSVLCLLCLCACLFIFALRSPAGKGLTSCLSFVVSAVSLSLSHWYPGSSVVLDCIDSWSLHPYLLRWRLRPKLGDNYIQNCIPGGLWLNIRSEIKFNSDSLAVKHDFRMYILRYTSPNEIWTWLSPFECTSSIFPLKKTVKM